MKGDLTRSTFDPASHFGSVRLQQGRVLLDADWNEQADIAAHRHHTTARDLIGGCGGPLNAAAFGVVADPDTLPQEVRDALAASGVLPLAAGDVLLGAGRYYVDGVLCECERAFSLLHQPDPPGTAPLAEGRHLLYLRVWERHLTWLDDPSLREVALGGPDTATRARVVWQVGSLPLAADEHCLSEVEAWNALTAPSSGTLSARAELDAAAETPCAVAADAGYRGLENQLYRVEIHREGGLNQATFKWSRENGSVVTAVRGFDGQDVEVGEVGRDELLAFASGQWVELVHDGLELAGEPGELFEVLSVDPGTGVVRLASAPTPVDAALRPKLRRWESAGALTVRTPAANGGWLRLEGGVEVRFSAGTYRTGDYWQIPARTATAAVEWPVDDGGAPLARPPAGIHSGFCRLAVVEAAEDGAVALISDCRRLFPPVTELTDFQNRGGDGQEVMPDLTRPGTRVPLPLPLRVGVANGRWPVAGARVRWEVAEGNGRVAAGGAGATTLDSTTDDDGVATCTWSLLPTASAHRVRAVLLDVADQPIGIPIEFGAGLSVATQVAYDPRAVCGAEAAPGVLTVQDALDRLTRLTRLYYAGGDGQEAMPGNPLPRPLRVLVSNDCGPVEGATVRFTAEEAGRVAPDAAGLPDASARVEIRTDSDGVAECFWLPAPDRARPVQEVVASLEEAARLPVHPPRQVRFTGQLSVAAGVAYDGGDCALLAETTTVQEALDRLCAASGGGTADRVRVQDLRLGDLPLRNDRVYSPETFAGSPIIIECDESIDFRAARRPVCSVVLELPSPDLWDIGAGGAGFLPLVVAGTLQLEDRILVWEPTREAAVMIRRLGARFNGQPILARLTVRGNFVWAAQFRERWLDGDLFGIVRDSGLAETVLPTGDGVRGGSLEMWFWIRPPLNFTIELGSPTLTARETMVGRLVLEQPAPPGGMEVRLASTNPELADVPQTVFIREGETEATFEARVSPPEAGTSSLTLAATVGEDVVRQRVRVTRGG